MLTTEYTKDLSRFIEQYMLAVFFTDGEDLGDNDEISLEFATSTAIDCANFLHDAWELWAQTDRDISSLAYDFWLTRNGHGAGFWDGDWGEVGDKLTELCKPYGSVDVYVGDDGLIYGTP